MQTEHTLVFVLIIYMVFNLYTDVRWLVTKNWWHIFAFVLLFVYAGLLGVILNSLLAMIGGFFVGILFRKMFISYGAGDIKMLAVLFVGINLLTEGQVIYLLLYVLMYLLLSSIQVVFLKYLGKEVAEVPEAIPLFLALLMLILIIL